MAPHSRKTTALLDGGASAPLPAASGPARFVVQVGAGLTNLLLLAPIPMQLLHLLLADCVWLALVLLTVACNQAAGARR